MGLTCTGGKHAEVNRCKEDVEVKYENEVVVQGVQRVQYCHLS